MMDGLRRGTRWVFLFIIVVAPVVAADPFDRQAAEILKISGVPGGLIVHVGCGDGPFLSTPPRRALDWRQPIGYPAGPLMKRLPGCLLMVGCGVGPGVELTSRGFGPVVDIDQLVRCPPLCETLRPSVR